MLLPVPPGTDWVQYLQRQGPDLHTLLDIRPSSQSWGYWHS